MRKLIALVFGLFMAFLPSTDSASAAGNEEAKVFCDNLLAKAIQMTQSPEWDGLYGDSKHWAEVAANLAKNAGFSPNICFITFHNAATRWVITLNQGGKTFICDYYKILYELSEKHLETPSQTWHFMELKDYIRASMADSGMIFETLFSFYH